MCTLPCVCCPLKNLNIPLEKKHLFLKKIYEYFSNSEIKQYSCILCVIFTEALKDISNKTKLCICTCRCRRKLKKELR